MPDFTGQFVYFKADLDDENLVPFFTEVSVTTNPQLLLFKQGASVAANIGCVREDKLRELMKNRQEL